jgi:hypothetical protein
MPAQPSTPPLTDAEIRQLRALLFEREREGIRKEALVQAKDEPLRYTMKIEWDRMKRDANAWLEDAE